MTLITKCSDITNGEIPTLRCNVPDISIQFVPQGKWYKTDLTYKFVNFNISLSKNTIRDAFILACNIWSVYAPLTFREVQDEAVDITIGFYDASHNVCGYCNPGFSNKRNYAHGFFPPTVGDSEIAGDIHFNKAVMWTTEPTASNDEIDFVTVAAHELGHVFGLNHVGLREALMNASCQRPHRFLHDDDIRGIQSLYGHQ